MGTSTILYRDRLATLFGPIKSGAFLFCASSQHRPIRFSDHRPFITFHERKGPELCLSPPRRRLLALIIDISREIMVKEPMAHKHHLLLRPVPDKPPQLGSTGIERRRIHRKLLIMMPPSILDIIEVHYVWKVRLQDVNFASRIARRVRGLFCNRQSDDLLATLHNGLEGEMASLQCPAHGRGKQ